MNECRFDTELPCGTSISSQEKQLTGALLDFEKLASHLECRLEKTVDELNLRLFGKGTTDVATEACDGAKPEGASAIALVRRIGQRLNRIDVLNYKLEEITKSI